MALIQEETYVENRIDHRKLNSGIHGNLIYDKGTISNPLGKDGLVSKWFCHNWVVIYLKKKVNPSSSCIPK